MADCSGALVDVVVVDVGTGCRPRGPPSPSLAGANTAMATNCLPVAPLRSWAERKSLYKRRMYDELRGKIKFRTTFPAWHRNLAERPDRGGTVYTEQVLACVTRALSWTLPPMAGSVCGVAVKRRTEGPRSSGGAGRSPGRTPGRPSARSLDLTADIVAGAGTVAPAGLTRTTARPGAAIVNSAVSDIAARKPLRSFRKVSSFMARSAGPTKSIPARGCKQATNALAKPRGDSVLGGTSCHLVLDHT